MASDILNPCSLKKYPNYIIVVKKNFFINKIISMASVIFFYLIKMKSFSILTWRSSIKFHLSQAFEFALTFNHSSTQHCRSDLSWFSRSSGLVDIKLDRVSESVWSVRNLYPLIVTSKFQVIQYEISQHSRHCIW